MAYNGIDVSQEPSYLSDGSYTADSDRRWFEDIMRDGVIGTGDFLVSAGTGGAMHLSVAAGRALVPGLNVTDQGKYRVKEPTALVNAFDVPASDPSKNRIDAVILRVFDASNDASGVRKARFEVVPGTPTTGADLNSRQGAADLTTLTDSSKSVLHLADVRVTAGGTTTNTMPIRDRRKLAWPKNAPYTFINNNLTYTVTALNTEADLIPAQIIPGYLMRDADYDLTKPRHIKIRIRGELFSSAGTLTTVWKLYFGRGDAGVSTNFWTDTTPGIPASGTWRPFQMDLNFLVPTSALFQTGFWGRIFVGGVGATAGLGDIGAAPLIYAPISSQAGTMIGGTLPLISTNCDLTWKLTTQHSTNVGTFTENIFDIVTSVT